MLAASLSVLLVMVRKISTNKITILTLILVTVFQLWYVIAFSRGCHCWDKIIQVKEIEGI